MFPVEKYYEADSLTGALDYMANNHEFKVIAGGTDLLVEMRKDKLKPLCLIDISHLEDLKQINLDTDGSINIGAMISFSQLARDPVILTNLPILAEAALTVGGPQLRNMATIGGNICNGSPSADSVPPLLAFNAQLKIQSVQGNRLIPLQDFFLGPGKVDLQPGELLTAIMIKPGDYQGYNGCFIKFSPRKAMDLAIINVATLCKPDKRNCFEDIRISLGVAGPKPLRCFQAEAFAKGRSPNQEMIEQIAYLTLDDAQPRSSARASKEYRSHLIVELTRRSLLTTIARTGGYYNAENN